MNFKGGVIIVGSLLWDEEPKRHKWRKLCLKESGTKIPVALKIRYGRKSSSRNDTYTMIFSNDEETGLGQGCILEFAQTIKNFKNLSSQAFALASAEGLWKSTGPSLNKSWGTIGLLVNPNVDIKNEEGANIIKERWTNIYSEYKSFDNLSYRVAPDHKPVIDNSGFLTIDWTDEMDDFDFLIATPVVPNVDRLLTAEQIANQMIEGKYTDYFTNNRKFGIHTFQDEEIMHYLNQNDR